MTEYIIIAALFVIVFVLTIYLFILKKQIRSISQEIKKNKEVSYNRLITTDVSDKEVAELAISINDILQYHKELGFETERIQDSMKKSASDIAHDIRTPITVINGNLQLLEKTELDKRQREYVRVSMERTESLKSIVDDFFEMSLLESDQLQVVPASIDMTAFIIQFMIDHESIIRQHGLEPELNLPEKSIFIKADAQLLIRIFDNMLNNTFKYAKHSFGITLTEDGCTMFSNEASSDNQVDVDRLFDRSYRGDKARPDSGSKGLGLYIVKLLAEKQGGSVTAVKKDNRLCISLKFNTCNPV